MNSLLFLNVTKRILSVSYRLSSESICPIGFPETSVTNYQSTLRNISEERRFCYEETSDFIKDEELLNYKIEH
jgi:hypothetical protein